jgi:hypothetical protein
MSGVILAIDPGTENSGWVKLRRDGEVVDFGITDNVALVAMLDREMHPFACEVELLAIEMIASYGMPVGSETFETCVWIGRFIEKNHGKYSRAYAKVYRKDVKLHLCQSPRAKDAMIRQALIDRYGPGKEKAIGQKKCPGPLYGVTKHVWAALAVGCYALDNIQTGDF